VIVLVVVGKALVMKQEHAGERYHSLFSQAGIETGKRFARGFLVAHAGCYFISEKLHAVETDAYGEKIRT
jgi:hypothetical protein